MSGGDYCIRYGSAGYGAAACVHWHIGKFVWTLRGRPYPGFAPASGRTVGALVAMAAAALLLACSACWRHVPVRTWPCVGVTR